MKLIAITIILISGIVISAQNRTFQWQDELCTYVGTYDARKVTAVQLRNTRELARPGSFSLETNNIAWTIADINKLNVAALDREYRTKSAVLRSLNIVRTSYWLEFRKQKLEEMRQVYRLNRTTMRGYRNPTSMIEYEDAPECTRKYAFPLIKGGAELLAVWESVNMVSRAKNSDPERLRTIYEEQLRSENKMNYALLEVMSFGWSNCANDLIKYIEYDGTPENEFKKIFRRTRTISCDEP